MSYNNEDVSNEKGFWLESESLNSKYGFHDGDLLGSHSLLIKVVEKYLVPLVPPECQERIEYYNTIHNPIRCDIEVPRGICVYITPDMVESAEFELRYKEKV